MTTDAQARQIADQAALIATLDATIASRAATGAFGEVFDDGRCYEELRAAKRTIELANIEIAMHKRVQHAQGEDWALAMKLHQDLIDALKLASATPANVIDAAEGWRAAGECDHVTTLRDDCDFCYGRGKA